MAQKLFCIPHIYNKLLLYVCISVCIKQTGMVYTIPGIISASILHFIFKPLFFDIALACISESFCFCQCVHMPSSKLSYLNLWIILIDYVVQQKY